MAPRVKVAALVSVLAICTVALTVHIIAHWTTAAEKGWTGLSYEAAGAHVRADDVEPGSPAMHAGIQAKDVILEINGIPVHDVWQIDEIRKKVSAGAPLTYTIEHDSATRRVTVRLENPLRWPFTLCRIALNVIAGYLFVAVAAFVFWRRANDSGARVFLVTWALFGFVRLLLAAPLHAYTPHSPENVAFLFTLIALSFFISPTLLHFALIFPRTRPVLQQNRSVLRWIYLPPAIGAVLILLAVAAFVFEHTFGWNALQFATRYDVALLGAATAAAAVATVVLARTWTRSLRGARLWTAIVSRPATSLGMLITLPLLGLAATEFAAAYAGVPKSQRMSWAVPFLVVEGVEAVVCVAFTWLCMPVCTCVALVRSYRESNREQKQQIRWPLFGIVLALTATLLTPVAAGVFLYVARVEPGTAAWVWTHFVRKNLPVIAWLLVPIAFAFSILKYRLMEITVYIRRTVIYGLLTGILAIVFLVCVTVLGAVFASWTGVRGNWPAAASTVAVALVFLPVRQRVQALVDRRFFRRRRDRTALTKRLTEAIGAASTPAEVFAKAVDLVQEAIGSRWVIALSSGDSAFVPVASTGVPDEKLRVVCVRAAGEYDWAGLDCGHVARIATGGREFGFMACGTKLSDEQYSPADLDFVAAAAHQIALQLENLGLRCEHADFERAREIQEGLLPRTLPKPAGLLIDAAWEPARAVGGDYYDVFEMAPSLLAVAIGDVSGKGLPAALLMSNLQAVVRTVAPDCGTLASQVCERVNRAMCGRIAGGAFLTLFYAVVDTATRTMYYCSAGHNPPVLCRADGRIIRLSEGGTVIGVFAHTRFEEEGTVALDEGDRLVFFTDGVTEAFNEEGEEFGDERLIEIVRDSGDWDAAALQKKVMEAAREFCSGEFQDDATVIAIVVPRAAAAAR